MHGLDRAIKLHRLLAARRATCVSLEDMREVLDECSVATVKRVMRKLREEFGAPLIYDRERSGFRYNSEFVFEIPGLWFTAGELSALLVMDELLNTQPKSLLAEILGPLRQRLDDIARQRDIALPVLRKRIRVLRMAARDSGPHFSCVTQALAQSRRLRIDYHARSTDRMRPREVSPQRLTQYRDNWYLDAWCHARKDLRTFALDRIIAVEVLDVAAQIVEPSALEAVLATSYGVFAGIPSAMARLHFSASAKPWIASEQWHPQQRDQLLDDGSLTRELPYHHADELVMDILRLGADVEVLAPAALRRAVRGRLQAALARYAAASPELVSPSRASKMNSKVGSTIRQRKDSKIRN